MPIRFLDEEPVESPFTTRSRIRFLDEAPQTFAQRVSGAPERIEQRISGRESLLPVAARASIESLAPPGLSDVFNPIDYINRQMRGLTLPVAAAVGVPYTAASNAVLALQRGQPGRVLPDVLKGLAGEREATAGDVFVGAGIPEGVADVAGGGTEIALTPGGAQGAVNLAKFGLRGLRAGGRAVATTKAGRAVGRIGEVSREAITHPIEFLRGSPKRITQANRATHDLILSVRQGGTRHEPFFQRLGELADEAWEPMRRVARSIEEPVQLNDVVSTVHQMFPDDPIRVKQVTGVLRALAKKQTAFSGPELVDLSSQIGQRLPKNVLSGRGAARQLQQFKSDARSAIAEVLEQRAPESLKGAVSQAKRQWGSYKADQGKLFDIFKPGAAKEVETKAGVDFVQRVAKGDATEAEKDFLQRLTEQFPELQQVLTQRIGQAEKATKLSQAGGTTRKLLAGGTGLAALDYLLGRRPR